MTATRTHFETIDRRSRIHPKHALPRIGLVSTYPPTRCGLASFTAALRQSLARRRGGADGISVVRVVSEDDLHPSALDDHIVGVVDPERDESVISAGRLLSRFDAVILQHEYGIYGPGEGKAVLDLVAEIDAPVITTLHTVVADPTLTQRRIIEALGATSARMVVLTETARSLLCDHYDVAPESTVVIPHGTRWGPLPQKKASNDPLLLTWGLIGPGKGLETALQAVEIARARIPGLRYIIAGKTHPRVLEKEGETYRRCLEEVRRRLGLATSVQFIDDYLSSSVLEDLLHRAALVVLPYESTDQVVSGVLVEAVAATVPVVATAFPHAVELAEEGAAVTVPHKDPGALATAITGLLGSPERLDRIRHHQHRISKTLTWARVAGQYESLVGLVVRGRAPVGL